MINLWRNYIKMNKQFKKALPLIICFIIGVALQWFLADFLNLKDFKHYSDTITFLSVLSGFYITAIALLFDSPILGVLYNDQADTTYPSKLHRLKSYFAQSFYINIFTIICFILYPKEIFFPFFKWQYTLYKFQIIIPLLSLNIFCIYRISDILFYMFSLPRNTPK